MKKSLLLIVVLIPILVAAQNVQLHYDFGENRKYVTSTIEMFKPDEYGATFFFFDIDYDYPRGEKSASLAYLEFARYVNIPLDKFSATVQYNGGLTTLSSEQTIRLGPIWLGGASYPIDLGFVTLNTDVLYRTELHKDDNGAQLTITWNKKFLDGKLTFMGFFDLWSMDNLTETPVILTEPQLWYSLNKHLSIGGEVEFSQNFPRGTNDFEMNPTLGLKWQF